MTITPEQWAAVQELVVRALCTLIEQRREFERGEIRDLDDLEDALNRYDKYFAAKEKTP